MKIKFVPMVSIFIIMLIAFSCSQKQGKPVLPPEAKPGNVIMIIGDGMGPEQVGFLLTYARQAPHSVIRDQTTCFDRIMQEEGSLGLSLTNAHNVLVTDSAASASQLATGQYSGSEMIGLNHGGDPVPTVLEQAIQAGKATGLVSDTLVTHATPAAFAAHQAHRKMGNAIALDMLNTGPDVLLGGGLGNWIPRDANTKGSSMKKKLEEITRGSVPIKSKRKDNKNLLAKARQNVQG